MAINAKKLSVLINKKIIMYHLAEKPLTVLDIIKATELGLEEVREAINSNTDTFEAVFIAGVKHIGVKESAK